MDWPFSTYVTHPRPKVISGIAEIAGDRGGSWQVTTIYIEDQFGRRRMYRHADYDERRQIEMSLHVLAGGDIGRAYRRSMEAYL